MITIENVNKFMFQKLDKLDNMEIFKGKKLVLFGLNTSSYATKAYLEEKGYHIYAFIDNDRKKREDLNEYLDEIMPRHFHEQEYKMLMEKAIRAYTPEELLSEFDDNIVILIASKYYVSMCEQLFKMGYQEQKHIFQTVDFFGLDTLFDDEFKTQGFTALTQSDVREIQIQIAEHLKMVCKEHKLRYYMTGGTLLGAVRHKGYIPWDDDIDITMPMPDYLRLIQILQEDDDYEVLSIYNYPETCFNFFMRLVDKKTVMKTWEYPFLMTSGVYIDVFPLIALPEKNKDVEAFFNRIRNLNTRYMSTFLSHAKESLEIKQSRATIRSEVLKMMEQYDFDTCKQMGYILSKYWEKDIMPKEIYDEKVEMKFEDTSFAAPVGYREYLTRIFGDYMKLPPIKEQCAGHNYIAYRIED